MLTRRDFIKSAIAALAAIFTPKIAEDPYEWKWVEDAHIDSVTTSCGDGWKKCAAVLNDSQSVSIVQSVVEKQHISISTRTTGCATLEAFEDGTLLQAQSVGVHFSPGVHRSMEYILAPDKEYEFRLTSNSDDNDAVLLAEWYDRSVEDDKMALSLATQLGLSESFLNDPLSVYRIDAPKVSLSFYDYLDSVIDEVEWKEEPIKFTFDSYEQHLDGSITYNNCRQA